MLFNVHSANSLLASTLTIPAYVEAAKERGYQILGLADVHSLQGALDFYNRCQAAGLKAMIGATIKLPGALKQTQVYPFLVYALNQAGYYELIGLIRRLSHQPLSPGAIWDYLTQSCHNLVYISCGHASEVEQTLIHSGDSEASLVLERLGQVFGLANVYLGVAAFPYNPVEGEALKAFAKAYQVPLVVGQGVSTLNQGDAFSLKVLEAIGANETLDVELRAMQGVHYVYNWADLEAQYVRLGLADCLTNSRQLADRMQVSLPQNQAFLPKFPTPDQVPASQYLRNLTQVALDTLSPANRRAYQERLDYELEVIDSMGFSDYFLIVWDIIVYCQSHAIRVGPGRGSAAGSLVSYLLGITRVDPIQYNLLFERFLNPERYNMPDIDMDIPDNKRQQVLHYVVERYGQEQVAQIATLGTFGARAAMRDTLRVLGADSETLRVWARAIPKELDISLPQAYQKSAALRQLVSQSETNQQLFQVAQTIEGLPRHISTHAAAVVIHDQALDQVIPVVERPNQPLMTQFTMYDVEKVGLLKMDFLGLRNLNLLDTIIKQVQKSQADFDIEAISMEDAQTLALFRAADTNGVFQFESDGIKQVLRKLQPERFEDIVAVNALFRPGPMKQIDHYVARRHGKESYQAIHPILEEILAPTYGIIVYQEQVMQVCQRMAGFSLGQADLLRRAMGKKQADVMAREREHFIRGAREQGIEPEIASATYDYIYEFASYGFNRSHAVVYSTLAFQLAYLKVHYPLAFYQALLNMGSSNQTTMADYILEAKRHTGPLLGLNLNESQIGFSVSGQQLQVGLSAIRTLRHDFVSHIVEDRQLLGPYTGLLHFMQRLPKKWLKHEWLESLISVGAFDYTGMNRPTLLKNLDKLMQSVTFSGGNLSLFPELEPRIEWVEDWSPSQKRDKEVEILGFSLEGHPVATYQAFAKSHPNLLSVRDILAAQPNLKVQTLVLVKAIRVINTKKQELMAFLELEDEVASISGVVFPQSYRHYVSMLKEGQVLLVEGTVELDRQGRHQLIVKRLSPVNEQEAKAPTSPNQHPFQRCFVQVKAFQDLKPFLPGLRKFADQYSGPVAMVLVDANRQTFQLDDAYRVSYGQKAQEELAKLLTPFKIIYK